MAYEMQRNSTKQRRGKFDFFFFSFIQIWPQLEMKLKRIQWNFDGFWLMLITTINYNFSPFLLSQFSFYFQFALLKLTEPNVIPTLTII